MKKILISKENVKFSEITNKSKRKVYKEISKRYNGNNISENTPFDFYRDIYNKPIKIEFLLKIRDEIKFNTIEDLIQQIYKDRELALRFFDINF